MGKPGRSTEGALWALGAAAGLAAWRAALQRRCRLQDKGVFITGASRGLGLVLARQLSARGARVAICARDAEELERAKAQLASAGLSASTVVCDLGNQAQVEQAVQTAAEQVGQIDVLINNAGSIQVGPEETMDLEDFEQEMKVHFWGPLYAIRAVLPQMRARRQGRIVNITSIGGKISVPHLLPYSASKFALVGLSEGLTAELAKDGIAVTTVCPGLMRTGSPRNAEFKGRHRAEYAWFKLSDSLPPLAMDSERAARQIIVAFQRGDPEVVLSVGAKLASLFHGVFPGTTARMLGWMNRLLPTPGRGGSIRRRGHQSESALSSSWLTHLGDIAALRNNEI